MKQNKNRRKNIFVAVATILLLFSTGGGLFAQSAAEISKKSADIIDFESMEMDLTIIIRDARGSERVRQLIMSSGMFNGVSKTLIRFMAPSDVKGTALLIFDYQDKEDDMWIYMPALKKVRRIISSERGKSFMGSEFTNADMSKPNHIDFNYTLIGSATYEDKECWVVEAEGKDQNIKRSNGYSKSISYIEKDTYLCYKTEYYNMAGDLHRIRITSDYKNVTKSSYFAYSTVMENVKNGRVSEMKVNKIETGKHFREEMFSPNALQ